MLLLAELDAHPERLHLHAGLVTAGGRGVLVAGLSGSGKSTLVAGLVRSGFEYMTDERVAVDPVDMTLRAFPKPISLVPGSYSIFEDLHPGTTGLGHATQLEWHVPASALGTIHGKHTTPCNLVVFVKYDSGSQVGVKELHALDGVARLLLDSPDIARYGHLAVPLLARLCARARCIELTHDGLESSVSAVQQVLEGCWEFRPEPELHVLQPSMPSVDSSDVSRSVTLDDTLGWSGNGFGLATDGRAIVIRDEPAELVELDELSTAWLMLLDGSTTVGSLVEQVAREAGTSPRNLHASAMKALSGLTARGLATIVSPC
jgi:hypothetical protein